MADRYLFVTGKLAAPALRATLERAELPFEYEVAVMRITVAALMTTTCLKRSGWVKLMATVWPPPMDSPPIARLSALLIVR